MGIRRAHEFLHGRGVCITSLRAQKTLSAHDTSQTAVEKACTHFLEKSRRARLHFCLLLRHDAILRGKKTPQGLQKIDDIQNESECPGFKFRNKAKREHKQKHNRTQSQRKLTGKWDNAAIRRRKGYTLLPWYLEHTNCTFQNKMAFVLIRPHGKGNQI